LTIVPEGHGLENGLALSEARLLVCLQQFEPSTRRKLVEFTGIFRGRLSMLLSRLEGKSTAIQHFGESLG